MKSKRNAKLDNVKFFLICCVVLGHLGNRYSDNSSIVAAAQFWVYLFHMPAFVFLAGLFSKKTIDQNRWDRVVPYLFLYVLMKMFAYAVSVVLNGAEEASAIDFFSTNGVPWFAMAMCWWMTLSILVKKASSVYVLVVSILLSLASGYITEIGNFLVMQRTIIFFPFFYAGYLVDPEKLVEALDRWYLKVASVLLLAGSVAVSFLKYDTIYFWRFLFRGVRTYNNIGEGLPWAWGWTWRLAFYVIAAVLTLSLICIIPNINSVFTVVGRRTLSIYAFHNPMIAVLLHVVPGLSKWMRTGHIALHCLVLMTVIVAITALPVFDWPVRKLMNVPPRNKAV